MNLIKYDAARYALQVAVSVDEVKDIRDKAQAMAAYAKQANDTQLIEWATELKVRAERKAGQLLAEMPKATGTLLSGNSPRSHDATTANTLEDMGINKSQSSRWQKLASVPDEQFEQAVSAAKEIAGEVTTSAMLKVAQARNEQPSTPKDTSNKYEILQETINNLQETLNELTKNLEDAIAENETLLKAFEADDKLAEALAEAKKYRELYIIERRMKEGEVNGKNAYIKRVQVLERQLAKAQRA